MEQVAEPEPEPAAEPVEQDETVVFSATTEAPGSKTVLSQDGDVYHVLWAAGDVINVNGVNLTLQTEDQPSGYGPGETKGNFSGSNPAAGASSPKYRAIYPSSIRDAYGNYNLPAEQPYLAGGVAAFPMYAEADERSFSFRNLCGIIQLNLKGDKSVSVISLSDRADADPKPMSGRFTVSGDAAVPTGTNGTALVCASPVALNTETFTPFFITVPAAEYGKLRIIIEATDGTTCTLTSKSAVTVERSMIKPINISNPNFKNETAQITYITTNTTKIDKWPASADASIFGDGLTVVSHNYNSETKTGVITFSGQVTSIGYYAFRGFSNLKSVTIPNTVTSIGERGFGECSSLESVNFPRTLTTIGNDAFVNCGKFVPEDLSHITSIGAEAFQHTKISGPITLHDGLTSIGNRAFYDNDSLTEVIVEHTPATMGNEIFKECDYITTVTFADDIVIPASMFESCDRLSTINFDADVSAIGDCAFNVCRAITSLTLPSSVTSIGQSAFANCSGIETIDFSDNISFIGRAAFAQCTSLEELVLPVGLATLNDRENFSGCTSLTTVVFPVNETFHAIPYLCFDGCTNLVSTSFPANITSIGQTAFRNCGFTALPEGWGRKTITYGDQTYRGCPITSITFPDDWTSVPNNFCWGWKSLQEVDFGTGITSIGGSAFRDCTALTDGSRVVIPVQVNFIGSYCFASSGLTSLPAGINRAGISMDDHVFSSSALTSVDISNWTTISQGCFQECGALRSATLGSSLTSIKAYAFYNCPLFDSVTLPASLTEMGNYCFRGTALADIPAGLHDCNFGEHIFEATPMTSITLPDGMTTVPNYMFSACASLTTVDLNDVTTLGNFAFSGCSLLGSVSAPEVVTVGNDAFYRNYALVSIDLPSVVTVKGEAFCECSHLETVDFGSHITSIGQDCFNNMQEMQAIYIRNGAAIVSLATRFTNYPAHPKPLIYVPEGLLDSYKGNVAWSQYRDYFRGLDIPVTVATVSSMQLGDGSTPYYSIEGIVNAFNENGGTLTFLANNTSELTFSGTSGIVDMNGHTQNKVFWMQNTEGSITIRNGTFTQTGDCFDGKTGFNDGYGGTVILENITVNGILWTDSHPFVIRSGNYNQIRNMKKNTVTSDGSGTVTIEGGTFKSFYNYNASGWAYGDYYISGGKFAFDPETATNVTIVPGYHVEDNIDGDSATFPYKVVAD